MREAMRSKEEEWEASRATMRRAARESEGERERERMEVCTSDTRVELRRERRVENKMEICAKLPAAAAGTPARPTHVCLPICMRSAAAAGTPFLRKQSAASDWNALVTSRDVQALTPRRRDGSCDRYGEGSHSDLHTILLNRTVCDGFCNRSGEGSHDDAPWCYGSCNSSCSCCSKKQPLHGRHNRARHNRNRCTRAP